MSRIRGRLSFANVVSVIALVFALGLGGAWAATELDKNEVKSKHIGKGQVKNADLANDAVTSPKVANGSLVDDDFAPGQLPQGSQGPEGPRGPAGNDAQFNGAAAGGALTGSYPNPGLAPDESVHVVGSAGEPGFNAGTSSRASDGFVAPGFYKSRYGVVHLQGTVDAIAGGGNLFTLPSGYRPTSTVCFSAPAFVGEASFTTNRICVGASGVVANDRGTGDTIISLDGMTFRTAG